MKIKILNDAQEELMSGFRFYESREFGAGSYFLDSLFSDIDSLVSFAGIHQLSMDIIAVFLNGFHSPSTMTWMQT